MKKKRTGYVRPGFVILLGLGLLGGCSLLLLLISIVVPRLAAYQPGFTPELTRIFAAQIQQGDVPAGWGHRDASIIDLANAEGRSISYYGVSRRDSPWIKVTQRIYLFSSVELAVQGFEEQAKLNIPAESAHKYVFPSELESHYQADQMQVGCLPSRINGIPSLVCKVTARYEDMLILIYANVFEDRWLTMADFRRVLEAMDRRAVAANAQHKEATPAEQ
jgi:hypothetical protein